jgi:hypothetical protein
LAILGDISGHKSTLCNESHGFCTRIATEVIVIPNKAIQINLETVNAGYLEVEKERLRAHERIFT